MTEYHKKLKPWAVFRLPNNICVARFHRRSDAEGHAKVLRSLAPGKYEVMFDVEK
jgi:hypothetical protein